MDEIVNALINTLYDNYETKFFVAHITDGSISGGSYNLINNYVDYDSDEFGDCLDATFELYDDLNCFDNPGVYVYKFEHKNLVDYKYIPAEKSNVYHGNEVGYVALYNLYNLEPLEDKAKEKLKENLQIDNIFNQDNNDLDKTNLTYNGIEIKIPMDFIESQKHIQEDFNVIKNTDMEKLIKEQYLPWFKGDDFKDADDEQIYNGLKITAIDYFYHRIVEEYSPTHETDYFGEFQFTLLSSSDYTKDMLDAVSMNILINKGKIVEVSGYNI